MTENHLKLKDLDESLIGYGIITFVLLLRRFERVMARFDLSFGEFTVLMHLSMNKQEINLRQVKENTFLFSGASITKVTEKLVRKGLVTRRENPLSRREKLVKSTPDGEKLVNRVLKEERKLYGSMLQGLDAATKWRFLKDVKVILANLLSMTETE